MELSGKRVAALDFGKKRIGMAICDETHIAISPRGFIENDPAVWDNIGAALERERAAAVAVGVPYRADGTKTAIILDIEEFIATLRTKIAIPVIAVDESFSSQYAFETMRAAQVKKKARRQKGRKDEVAAAIILRDFLADLS